MPGPHLGFIRASMPHSRAPGVATHSQPCPVHRCLGVGASGELTFHPRCSCRTPRRGRISRRNLSCPTYWHRTALWRHPGKEGGQGGEAEGSQGLARAVRVVASFCVFVFQGRFSLSNSPGCPRTRSVDQAGLEFTEIHLPLPPECWD